MHITAVADVGRKGKGIYSRRYTLQQSTTGENEVERIRYIYIA